MSPLNNLWHHPVAWLAMHASPIINVILTVEHPGYNTSISTQHGSTWRNMSAS
jgi:hypothetical protein